MFQRSAHLRGRESYDIPSITPDAFFSEAQGIESYIRKALETSNIFRKFALFKTFFDDLSHEKFLLQLFLDESHS